VTPNAVAERQRVGPVAASALAFALLGLVDLVVAIAGQSGSRDAITRAEHHGFTLLEYLVAGAAAAWATAGLLALRRAIGRVAYLALVVALGVVAWLTLPGDLYGAAEKLSAPHAGLLAEILAQVIALDAFAILFVAVFLAGTRLRILLLGPGLAASIASALILAGEYPAVHLWIVLASAGVVACALNNLSTTRARRWATASTGARATAIAVSIALFASLFAPIPHAVLALMVSFPGAFLAPYASRLRPLDIPRVDPPPEARAWFSSRAKAPPTPHVPAHALPKGAVVVLITIDAVRADVVMGGKYDAELPNLAKLRAESVAFAEARSPAPQTVPSLTGVMTGKYFSQLYWSGGAPRHAWPAADKSPRFPAVLRNAGVVTVTFPSIRDLEAEQGITRGFAEENVVETESGEPSPYWNEMLAAVKSRLVDAASDSRPMFLFAHFMDPHAPYTRGGTDCEVFECYVREVGLVDRAIGEFREVLDGPGLGDRSALIVTADHGEAFGEHGTFFHALNLYEELLHVPLLVHGRAFEPRLVDTKVTLLDIGPTVLDLYGLDTPGGFMGESLAGVLLGEAPHFTRPIAAESGRFKQALYFDDGFKLMFDEDYHLLELYDLERDPHERHALYDEAPDAAGRFGLLHLLFEANAFKKPGYSRPFRK
jgi:arylsulfatase A-like enzyme